jgi:hypothetical protein
MSIADDIGREVMAGEQVETAVELEADHYGATHASSSRLWDLVGDRFHRVGNDASCSA